MKVELENSTRYMFKIELKSKVNARLHLFQLKFFLAVTVWSEVFLYKVAPPELKISPNVYFIMYNSVVLSKILPIIVP